MRDSIGNKREGQNTHRHIYYPNIVRITNYFKDQLDGYEVYKDNDTTKISMFTLGQEQKLTPEEVDEFHIQDFEEDEYWRLL